jgi:hypothetical protein
MYMTQNRHDSDADKDMEIDIDFWETVMASVMDTSMSMLLPGSMPCPH